MSEVARLEHEVLSPGFLAWLRGMGDLNHEGCPICEPPIYYSGVVGNMHTKALDCPFCGARIRSAAAVLVRRDYARHLSADHGEEWQP